MKLGALVLLLAKFAGIALTGFPIVIWYKDPLKIVEIFPFILQVKVIVGCSFNQTDGLMKVRDQEPLPGSGALAGIGGPCRDRGPWVESGALVWTEGTVRIVGPCGSQGPLSGLRALSGL